MFYIILFTYALRIFIHSATLCLSMLRSAYNLDSIKSKYESGTSFNFYIDLFLIFLLIGFKKINNGIFSSLSSMEFLVLLLFLSVIIFLIVALFFLLKYLFQRKIY